MACKAGLDLSKATVPTVSHPFLHHVPTKSMEPGGYPEHLSSPPEAAPSLTAPSLCQHILGNYDLI